MNLNRLIDHTVLKPETTQGEIETLCQEAIEHNFMSVCVQPTWVNLAADLLKGSQSVVCTVIGFPLGANTTKVKAFEAADAEANGAKEVDMVINIGWVKDEQWEKVLTDIKAVVEAVKEETLVKVIVETALLTTAELERVTEIVAVSGAEFIKTSTGFSTAGAQITDVELMSRVSNGRIKVKASGGVRTKVDADKMVAAGANRIGTSNGIEIVAG
ncbi:deoxyribose-phosphate aldolase [Vagococcus salmoninarum]|uniref:Deoxyribose-phosphate aldolase n=1 Tax=Vagococcus salmoninarum TaxID=2739 RepID=A0A429ZVR2_9ENTE|nr:deoxyribose-phosphate aldolase [Vagococcus salmoninarum]RST97867.1 deoxyribose-phosphate aldolase [Vagococcus salmoninarum]